MIYNPLNVRTLFRGVGASDAKMYLQNLDNLDTLITTIPEFYQTNDLIWVVSEKSFYTLTVPTTGPITYEVFGTGGGSVTTVATGLAGTLYYGREQDMIDYWQGVANSKPSLRKYKDGDGIISSTPFTIGNEDVLAFDLYIVGGIAANNEQYTKVGNLLVGVQGPQGPQGLQGEQGLQGTKGDQGDPLQIDHSGPIADRSVGCVDWARGESYLATDEGLLYFKTSEIGDATEGACTWSTGIPFGRGADGNDGTNGATTYFIFKRDNNATVAAPNTPANQILPAGWTDAPGIATPGTDLWMSKTTYALDNANNPILPFTWSVPTKISGDEGKDAGFWAIWSDIDPPDRDTVPTNLSDATLAFPPGSDWYDDIDPNVSRNPIWLAQTRYTIATDSWTPWFFSKVTGEAPSYNINLFTRVALDAGDPNVPMKSGSVLSLPYKLGDGSLISGAYAATEADNNWFDGPPAEEATATKLFATQIMLVAGTVVNNWATPYQLNGPEGVQGDVGQPGANSGIWTIWSANVITDRPADVNVVPSENFGDLLNINPRDPNNPLLPHPTLPQDPEWFDNVQDNTTGNPIAWMATNVYGPVAGGGADWRGWVIAQVKGETGDPYMPDPIKSHLWYSSILFPENEPNAILGNYIGTPEASLGRTNSNYGQQPITAWDKTKIPTTVVSPLTIASTLGSYYFAIHEEHPDFDEISNAPIADLGNMVNVPRLVGPLLMHPGGTFNPNVALEDTGWHYGLTGLPATYWGEVNVVEGPLYYPEPLDYFVSGVNHPETIDYRREMLSKSGPIFKRLRKGDFIKLNILVLESLTDFNDADILRYNGGDITLNSSYSVVDISSEWITMY